MNIKKNIKYIEVPVIPLRDVVVFPKMIISLIIGRKQSLECLNLAINEGKKIILVTQQESYIKKPNLEDLFLVGTLSIILQMVKLPNGTIKILIEGLNRSRILNFKYHQKYLKAKIKNFNIVKFNNEEKNILINEIIFQFEYYLKFKKNISSKILSYIYNIKNPENLIDIIANNIIINLDQKQSMLEIVDLYNRLDFLISIIDYEISIFYINRKIKNNIKNQIDNNQREYYLHEQLKAIQKELGYKENSSLNEYRKLKQKIRSVKLTNEVKKKIKIELNKFKMMSPMSSEASVIRNYIDWLISVPWYKTTKIIKDIKLAEKILNEDHYGLNEIKEYILEYLAVNSRVKKNFGPILCLIGPPGVGKTSLGKSIAKSTGRKYARIALGGICDEAEIRGHRRTYIAAMPGKLIQKISKIGVKNPVILLDEIDKISNFNGNRGDPYSALLEVLDPEQNSKFNDHYLEIDYDFSNVMFIATSNTMNIPSPLLDRMEIIKLSGYTEDEKLNIAKKYLLPKQFKINSLKKKELFINDKILINIIRNYTQEAGVRNLERNISKICRKTIKIILTNNKIKSINLTKKKLINFLGIKKFFYKKSENKNCIGQVTGLAWTEFGGDLITIETSCILGRGKLIQTGSLGNVMKESIYAALTVVRSKSRELNINSKFHLENDIHIHIPEGATPKDGPSAGISICTALVSCLTKNPVKANIAMTGEITILGHILPIGGLKEKLLAALRGGIKLILIPYGNKHDLKMISNNILKNFKIYLVKEINEVLKITLKNNIFI